jgi:hypothetical protein
MASSTAGVVLLSSGLHTARDLIALVHTFADHISPSPDCSGFVSAAWDESDAGGGFVTSDFPCYQIDASQLQMGDALLNPSEHVAMFMGWDANHNPIVVEECGHVPAVRLLLGSAC